MNLLKNSFLIRFLLSKSKWRYSIYEENSDSAIKTSLSDLDLHSNHVSVFITKNLIDFDSDKTYKSIHLIAFLFSATIRNSCQDLCYIDLNNEDLSKLKIKMRYNKKTASISDPLFSDYHYEIFLTNNKKRKLSNLIFNKIGNLPDKKLPVIKKSELKLIKTYFHSKHNIKNIDVTKFHEWALKTD